jgi:hypothetical protein
LPGGGSADRRIAGAGEITAEPGDLEQSKRQAEAVQALKCQGMRASI